jgi:23S rRNA (adenine2503-C2)-methyltransferase
MTDFRSMTLQELKEYLQAENEPSYRAVQIYEWIHKKAAGSFAEMTNLPEKLREKLNAEGSITPLQKITVQISKLDDTHKYLFELPDGNRIESVMMRYRYGNSVCVSSQVGCRMGCRFCASTIDGLERNLTAGEMLGQIYEIGKDIGERISNVVIMGSGEPLDNYDNVVKFIRMLSDENGLNISQRNITLSTCGIVPGILKLAEENFQITLALSLHASDDETRRKLMPVALRYSIAEILKACGDYFAGTGRRVTFEYSLVSGVNDTREEAKKLSALLRHMQGHVNLIPVNPVEGKSYRESGPDAIASFQKELENNGINVTIRREMGRDIDGACGQLKRHYAGKNADEG